MGGYLVASDPANIAPTPALRASGAAVQVFGQPRMTKGHPNVYWDQEDIDHYKEMLKTSKELQLRFQQIKDAMDARIAQPIDIPPVQPGVYPGDYFPPFPDFPDDPPLVRFKRHFRRDSDAVSDLGTLYALTGDEKYAEYAKKLLMSYAVADKYAVAKGSAYNLSYGMGLCTQFLDEEMYIHHFVRGYDLIYNLPSWTADERKQLHDEFFYPWVSSYLFLGMPKKDPQYCSASQLNNRGVFANVAVLSAGYATDDQELIDGALYGVHWNGVDANNKEWPPPKNWIVGTADHPDHGLLNTYFGEPCIPGGMWVEGSTSYAYYALCSMVGAAEIVWHHGIDLYGHNNAIFKYMFDFPILMSYPDLTTPAFGDSHRDGLMGICNNQTLYEYAYRRYHDPSYLAFINSPDERAFLTTLDPKITKNVRYLNLTGVGSAPPSVLFELDPNQTATLGRSPSVNYPAVGFGFLRTQSSDGKNLQNLIMSYGPSYSHGHPDKLQIDLFAMGDVLMPSPGCVFPYNNPLVAKWYYTTVAHNTLTVDEKNQANNIQSPAHADQVIFGPASTIGIQRAWTDTAYQGATMDRAVFITTNYLADIFGVFSGSPHKYDLAWHIRGEVSTDLNLNPYSFDAPVPNGYNVFTNIRQATADKSPWSMTLTRGNNAARLFSAAATATQIIVADGGTYVDNTTKDKATPTILERRDQIASTVYGNVLDFAGGKDAFVKGVTQEGGLDVGYGLLRVATATGTDLCFAAYHKGSFKPAGLETDALQAFVRMNGTQVEALYLAGGKSLSAGEASITRSEPGLAYVEKTLDGSYIIANPSPTEATVTVTLTSLSGLTAFTLSGAGQRETPLEPAKQEAGPRTFDLKAGEKIGLSPK